MSENTKDKGQGGSASQQGMVIHNRVDDAKGLGKRDAKTGRYIPIGGGSRMRLPVFDDPRVPRYPGFVGVNPSQSENVYTMPVLFSVLGGKEETKQGRLSKLTSAVVERRVEEQDEEGKDDLAI